MGLRGDIMKKYLAIDIGGSKTRLVVFEEKGELEDFEIRGIGLAVDSDEDIPEFRAVLCKIQKKYKIDSICVNLGGKNSEQIRKILSEVFEHAKIGVYRESQGKTALSFARMHGADACLLAGTGTILSAEDDSGRSIICGGWGPNISDEGSGYYIGLEAIKKSLSALDNTYPLTPLEKDITGLGAPFSVCEDADDICRARDEVRARLDFQNRRSVAAIAKTVVLHAQNGEEDALLILKEAGEKLGLLSARCINKLLPYKAHGIAVSGGLVNFKEFWQESFEKAIRENSSVHDFHYSKDGITEGTKNLCIKISEE